MLLVGCQRDDRTALGQETGPCDSLVRRAEADLDIRSDELNVFVKESASQQRDLRMLQNRFEAMAGVRVTRVVDKDEAYRRAERLFRDNPDVMRDLPGNPFPASIELIVERERIETVQDELEAMTEVDDIKQFGEAARTLIESYWDGNGGDVLCELLRNGSLDDAVETSSSDVVT